MPPSTRNLSAIPDVEKLRRHLQSLAVLDAILEADWQYRYFSFNSRWSQSEQMGSMRNGSGDDLFAVFDSNGCFMRGFDHESPMSPWVGKRGTVWPGVLENVPQELTASCREPAFHMEDTTFCIWRLRDDSTWHIGPVQFPEGDDPDGSGWMLSLVCGAALGYQSFAADYFELEVSLDPIEELFAHKPLTNQLLSAFPTKRTWDELLADVNEIGYQVAT